MFKIYTLYSRSDFVELVCKKCGTVNNDKSIICMRCGSSLDTDKVTEYINIKGKTVKAKSIVLPFIIIYTLYAVLSVLLSSYLISFLDNFRNSFIFEFYNIPLLTEFVINGIYVAILFILNLVVTVVSLELISTQKFIELKHVKMCYRVICGYMIIALFIITIIKYRLDIIILLEHLISLVPVFPYIKRKCLKICIR